MTARQLSILISLLFLATSSALGANFTVEILGHQGGNHEGTRDNPFNGQGIKLEADINGGSSGIP